MSLFTDLLSAFEQDVSVTRYATWDDVLDYCRRSANPVGRIVLRLSGYRSEALDHASDAVCTALQLTNFWQDLAVDWSRGRLYVPEEIWRAHGADPRDLDRGTWTPAWRGRAAKTAASARGRCSTAAARSATASAVACATSCAPPGSAARAFSNGSSSTTSTCSPPGRRSAPRTGW